MSTSEEYGRVERRRKRNSASSTTNTIIDASSSSPAPAGAEIAVARFFKRYKAICLILLFLFLIQLFLTVRFILIQNETQGKSTRDLKIMSGHHEDTHVRSLSDQRSVKGELKSDDLDLEAKDSMEHVKSDIIANELLQHQELQQHNQSQSFSSHNTRSSHSIMNPELLGFEPRCKITNKESLSAIQRAKTITCKKQLVETTCKLIEGSLYPVRLSRICKSNENTYMKQIGCFKDDQKNRILTDHFALLKLTNSPENCVDMCLQSGFAFAGVQYSIECFCGNKRPSNRLIIPSDECNMKCPYNNNNNNAVNHTKESLCGGYFTMNVYETGVFNLTNQGDVKGLDHIKRELSTSSVSKKKVGIVFFLTLNGRAVRQVIRLIKALFRQHHYFYIHVDIRQDYLFRELQILNDILPNNVRFMQRREATIWGGASLLTVLLNGMEDLVENSPTWNWQWDYVINLSESDFPLKTIEELGSFLLLNNGKNFVKSHGRDTQKFVTKQGLDKTFVECEFRMWRIGDRKLPAGILFDGGSDWIALHKEFISYLIQTNDDLVKGLKVVYNYALLPAESFFHTVLRNSEFCETFVDNNLHVTNWKRKLGCKCQYRNIVDWCGCSPNNFRLADWNRLEATDSRLIFFGRKFESIVSQAIVNKLEFKLHPNNHDYKYETLDKYWQNIYHFQDELPKASDALLTLGYSLARITRQNYINGRIHFNIKVEEINAFVHQDIIQGVLVKFKIHFQDVSITAESWFKVQLGWVHFNEDEWTLGKYYGKFHNIRVGEDYDQKEQIFRNYAGLLGPNSEPTIAYSVYTDEAFNISFAWINPQGTIRNKMNVSIGVGETANFVKPTLKAPILTGNWTVNIQTPNREVITSVKFLVSPTEFYQGKLIRNLEDHPQLSNYNNISQLQSSIDEFISRYYTFQDVCFANRTDQILLAKLSEKIHIEQISSNKIPEFKICKDTLWSSLYPDPKGTIESIDLKTGLLLP